MDQHCHSVWDPKTVHLLHSFPGAEAENSTSCGDWIGRRDWAYGCRAGRLLRGGVRKKEVAIGFFPLLCRRNTIAGFVNRSFGSNRLATWIQGAGDVGHEEEPGFRGILLVMTYARAVVIGSSDDIHLREAVICCRAFVARTFEFVS